MSDTNVLPFPSIEARSWQESQAMIAIVMTKQFAWPAEKIAFATERLAALHLDARAIGILGADEFFASEPVGHFMFAYGAMWDGQQDIAARAAVAPIADDLRRLAKLREEMTVGMAWLAEKPARMDYACRRLGDAGALEHRQLPKDDPEYLSPGASWRLAMAYGEVWDRLS